MTANCPLCGTSVALLRRGDARGAGEVLRDRIEALRRRANELEGGAVTPRALKDDALWMCATCQPLISDAGPLDPHEVQRRIHEEVRRLERRRGAASRRAS